MCLSKAYLRSNDGARELVMSNVSGVKVAPGAVVLSDILGEEFPIPGSLAYIDLVGGELIINNADYGSREPAVASRE